MQPREAKWRSAGALVHSWGSHMSTTDHIAAVNTNREAMPSYTQPCQVIHSRKSPMSSSNHTTTLAYTCTCITGYVGTGQEMVIERFNAKPNRYYLHDAYHALIRFDFFSGMEGSLCWYSRLFLYATSSDSHSPSFKCSYRIPGVLLLFWLISSSPR